MEQIISPLCPFPNIYWWLLAENCSTVTFDYAEHFEKRSYRNRYYITGANGLIQLSIPLEKGRNQRTAMKDVSIDYSERWQIQHWRTIFSVYGNAPFFEFYASMLQPLFEKEYEFLSDFSMDTIHWVKQQLNVNFEKGVANVYQSNYDGVDIRKSFKPGIENTALKEQGLYYQLFEERNGFYPNLSILDILFSEGPAALGIIRANAETIRKWGE